MSLLPPLVETQQSRSVQVDMLSWNLTAPYTTAVLHHVETITISFPLMVNIICSRPCNDGALPQSTDVPTPLLLGAVTRNMNTVQAQERNPIILSRLFFLFFFSSSLTYINLNYKGACFFWQLLLINPEVKMLHTTLAPTRLRMSSFLTFQSIWAF